MFKKDEEPKDFETIIGPAIKIEGDFNGKGNILVQGVINGSISTDNSIKVDNGAKINANLLADSAIIAGEINGNVTTKNKLDILSTCKITGDIESKIVYMEAGAIFNGKCAMQQEDKKKEETPTIKK